MSNIINLSTPMRNGVSILGSEEGNFSESSFTKTHTFIDERKVNLLQQARTYAVMYKVTKQRHYLDKARELVEKVRQWDIGVAA